MISNFLTVLFVLRSVYTGTPAYTCLLVETAHARDGKVHWALHFLHRQPAPRAHLHTRRRHTRHFLHVCARHLSIHLPLSFAILLSLSQPLFVPSLFPLFFYLCHYCFFLSHVSFLYSLLYFSPSLRLLAIHSRSTCRLTVGQVFNFFPFSSSLSRLFSFFPFHQCPLISLSKFIKLSTSIRRRFPTFWLSLDPKSLRSMFSIY